MLVKIAEIFEISVSELLGEKIEETEDMNEIAVQLALLNEQLVNRSKRHKKILNAILITIVIVIAVCFLMTIAGTVTYTNNTDELTTVDLTCTLDDEEYYFSISYDEQYQVVEAGGDQWIADHVYTEQYNDAHILIAQIEDYFNDRGGEVSISD